MTREAGEKQDRLKKKHLLQVLSPGLGLRLREEPGAALDLKSKGPKGETGAVTTVVWQTRIEDQECWDEQRRELEKVCQGNEVGKEMIRADVYWSFTMGAMLCTQYLI